MESLAGGPSAVLASPVPTLRQSRKRTLVYRFIETYPYDSVRGMLGHGASIHPSEARFDRRRKGTSRSASTVQDGFLPRRPAGSGRVALLCRRDREPDRVCPQDDTQECSEVD